MAGQRHIFAVSDASGETCELLVQAALSQFKTAEVTLERVPNVRSVEQVYDIVQRAARREGVVIFTMVSPNLREAVQEAGRRDGVPTLDVLGPILTRLSDVLELSPLAQPGLLRHLDQSYFARIEAVDFTIKHDDGLGLPTTAQAEIVLVGVSRTSKTPTCIYLAYRGWRAANVPLVFGIAPPEELYAIDPKKIIGLTIAPDVLRTIRLNRHTGLKNAELGEYVEGERIREELTWARRLYERHGWPVIDTTHKSIEEISTEVMRIIHRRTGAKKGNIPAE